MDEQPHTIVEHPDTTYNLKLGAKLTAGAHITTTTAQWLRMLAELDAREGSGAY